jgi:hypothetical protein
MPGYTCQSLSRTSNPRGLKGGSMTGKGDLAVDFSMLVGGNTPCQGWNPLG